MSRRGQWHRLDGGAQPAVVEKHPCPNQHVHICSDCGTVARCCRPECIKLVAGRCVGFCPEPRRPLLRRAFGMEVAHG